MGERAAGRRRAAAAALAIVAWGGVLLQLWLSLRLAEANGKPMRAGLVAYLGFFTVLTNIFVAMVTTAAASHARLAAGGRLLHPQTTACAATSIALVGLAYHVLLRHVWDPQGLQWVADVVLHYVVPVAYCVVWLFALPAVSLTWTSPLAWSAYPLLYLAYALVRGAWLGTYPYPFIDVAALGYGRVLANAFGLLGVFVLVGWILLALRHALARRHGHEAG